MIPNNRALDSFKILIDSSKLLFDDRLDSKVIMLYPDTGELIKEFDRKPYEILENGIHTTYGIVKYFGAEFIYILISAKTLKEDYFRGINDENIFKVYKYIISQKIVDLTFSEFLNGQLTDVDIKSDFEMYSEPFKRMTYERKQVIKYAKLFSKDPNLGLEYVKRNIATPSNPFVKYYSKYSELVERSKDFKNFYFPHFHNLNYRRVEVTIRNKKHKQYMFRKKVIDTIPMTLKDWLELTDNDLKRIITHCVNQHEKNIVSNSKIRQIKRDTESLSSSDYFLYCLYEQLIYKGFTDQAILNFYLKRQKTKVDTHYSQKARINKKLIKFREIFCKSVTINYKNNPII